MGQIETDASLRHREQVFFELAIGMAKAPADGEIAVRELRRCIKWIFTAQGRSVYGDAAERQRRVGTYYQALNYLGENAG